MACNSNSNRKSPAWPVAEPQHYDDHDLLAFDGIPLTVLEHFSWTPAESEARARRRRKSSKQQQQQRSSRKSLWSCGVLSI